MDPNSLNTWFSSDNPSRNPFHWFNGTNNQMPPTSLRRASLDGTSTHKDCGTPSVQASSVQSGSSPPVIDNINLNGAEEIIGDKGNVSEVKKKYCARWSSVENEHLARCWVSISEDSITGNDQKLDQMWVRIEKEYNKHRPANTEERQSSTMKTHFYTVQRTLSAFNADYISVKEAWASGHNDCDILTSALKKWSARNGSKNFKLLGMWQILKECPKWANQVDRDHRGKKKMKKSTSGDHISFDNNNDNVEERTRPMGQKAAKNKSKLNAEGIGELKDAMEGMHELYNSKAEQKMMELREYNKNVDYEILMKDTAGMNPNQLHIHEVRCDEIKKKYGWE